MRQHIVLALLLTVLVPGRGQTAVDAGSVFPTDPHAVIKAASPFYDFTSPELKPWHLKAAYQLYDLKGKPTEQGTWDYWWVSPKVHHSGWTRAGVKNDEWSTAEGAVYRKEAGSPLGYFERTIEQILLSPLPERSLLDPSTTKLDLRMMPPRKPELACVFAMPQRLVDGKLQALGSGVASEYCFDPATKALLIAFSGQLTTQYNQLVRTQGRYLAKQVLVMYGKQVLFSVSVDAIESFNPADNGISPPADAVLDRHVLVLSENGAGDIAVGSLLKKTQPVYPLLSKQIGEQGVVVLGAVIGTDGAVHDLEVLAAPSPVLAQAAMDAVKKWEYRPYLLNGQAVEVETVVNVIFTLGR